MGIESYSSTAANNSAAPPMGWPEGMAPSAVNDTGRQMMADIRAWYESAEWIDLGLAHTYLSSTQFSISGGIDRTATYHVGRRIRAQGNTTGTIYGTVSAAAYGAPSTNVTVAWDGGAMQNEPLDVAVHLLSGNATAMPAVLARSGVKLLFPGIASAPSGWTIDASGANEQAAIRVRSSASTATGGSVDFTTAFANGSTGSYALVAADIPSHDHSLNGHTHGYNDDTVTSASVTLPGNISVSGGGGGPVPQFQTLSVTVVHGDAARTSAGAGGNTGTTGGGGSQQPRPVAGSPVRR